jgi:hypothetical protein
MSGETGFSLLFVLLDEDTGCLSRVDSSSPISVSHVILESGSLGQVTIEEGPVTQET